MNIGSSAKGKEKEKFRERKWVAKFGKFGGDGTKGAVLQKGRDI